MIMLTLTNEQAENFKFCSDNWKEIKKLKESGLFALKNGRFVIDKDEQGVILHTQTIQDKRWKNA